MSSNTNPSAAPDAPNRSEVLEAVMALLSDYCGHADGRNLGALCELFEPLGQLTVGDTAHRGHAAIAACLAARLGADRRTRHLWSNLRVDRTGSDLLRCTSTQITFEEPAHGGTSTIRVSDVTDVLRRDGAGPWRFHERTLRRVFSMDAARTEQSAPNARAPEPARAADGPSR
jgi:SnoaL-like domain